MSNICVEWLVDRCRVGAQLRSRLTEEQRTKPVQVSDEVRLREIHISREDKVCMHCLKRDFPKRLVVCNMCHSLWHLLCLPEPLPDARDDKGNPVDWTCHVCTSKLRSSSKAAAAPHGTGLASAAVFADIKGSLIATGKSEHAMPSSSASPSAIAVSASAAPPLRYRTKAVLTILSGATKNWSNCFRNKETSTMSTVSLVYSVRSACNFHRCVALMIASFVAA
jgi:hypothetical protein